jgi:hypothetical protein
MCHRQSPLEVQGDNSRRLNNSARMMFELMKLKLTDSDYRDIYGDIGLIAVQ